MKKILKDPIDQVFREQLRSPEKQRKFVDEQWITMRALLEDRKKSKPGIIWIYRLSAGIAAMLLLVFGWHALQITKTITVITKIAKLENTKVPLCQSKGNATSISDDYSAADKAKSGRREEKTNIQSVKQRITKSYALTAINADSTRLKSRPQVALVEPVYHNDSIEKIMTAQTNTKPVPNDTKFSINKNFAGPRLSLSIIGAPDLNGVNNFKGSETGFNLALQVAYHLNNRLSIITGAGFAVKPYQTAFSNYRQSNPAWWSNTFGGNLPEQVRANCQVLDIPLNLNYALIRRSGSVFSFGAGLSSYIMLDEKYQFNFLNATIAPTELQIKNQNHHFFGVVNFNASYEQHVTSGLGLIIQPFVKLPVTQIGFGQVDLKSAGIALGFSWNIHSFKPQ